MKFASLLTIAGLASLALATPVAGPALLPRADICGQWDSVVNGVYTLYQDLWGKDAATSGSQCSGSDGLSSNTLKWHTKWTWAGGQSNVKSYANVVTKLDNKPLSSITSLPSTWSWSYTGTSLVANVAYDIFTSTTGSGNAEVEIMIWLAALGGAGPISSTGQPVATVTVAGGSWKLYVGNNGAMKVYSFVATNQVKNFSGDLVQFVKYLTGNQGLNEKQVLQSVGAGTEAFTGSGAVFTVDGYSLSMK